MFQKQPSIELHNGIEIPLYGLDTIGLNASEAYTFVRQAIDNGIRHIETAAEYGIEAEIGKVVGPVKTQFGYHLIKVEGRKEASVMPFEEVKDYIQGNLLQQKQNEVYTAKFRELEEKYVK